MNLQKLLKDVGLYGRVEDASVDPIPNTTPPMSIIRNIDIFSPLVDDPVLMGKIAACNTTNDIFAMNCREITGMLVFLGIPIDMPDDIPRGILQGMKDFLASIGSRISGGHTIHSGWPLMGGEATGIEETSKIIQKQMTVQEGDQLILTKPLGTQPAMAAYRVRRDTEMGEFDFDLLEDIPKGKVEEAIRHGYQVMTTSLQPITHAIHEFGKLEALHTTTDVTGFGLAGTLFEILENTNLEAEIHRIPVIRGTIEISDLLGYPLEEGRSSETAGGMLIAVKPGEQELLETALAKKGVKYWEIGTIRKPDPDQKVGPIYFAPDYQVEEIPFRED